MILNKKQDWRISFDKFVNASQNKLFEWGTWDCILFTDAMIKKLTGKNLLPKQWKWTNKEEAMKAIKKYGKGKGLAAAIDNAVDKVQGIYRIDPMFMTKGDFLVYKEETELTAIFDGFKILCPNSDDGLIVKDPITVEILAVWRIDG